MSDTDPPRNATPAVPRLALGGWSYYFLAKLLLAFGDRESAELESARVPQVAPIEEEAPEPGAAHQPQAIVDAQRSEIAPGALGVEQAEGCCADALEVLVVGSQRRVRAACLCHGRRHRRRGRRGASAPTGRGRRSSGTRPGCECTGFRRTSARPFAVREASGSS